MCAGGAAFEMGWMKVMPALLNPGKFKEPNKTGLEKKQGWHVGIAEGVGGYKGMKRQ